MISDLAFQLANFCKAVDRFLEYFETLIYLLRRIYREDISDEEQ